MTRSYTGALKFLGVIFQMTSQRYGINVTEDMVQAQAIQVVTEGVSDKAEAFLTPLPIDLE